MCNRFKPSDGSKEISLLEIRGSCARAQNSAKEDPVDLDVLSPTQRGDISQKKNKPNNS